MTLEEIIGQRQSLIGANNSASAHLSGICQEHKGAMGLVSDEFRQTVEYRHAKAQFDHTWSELRRFNHEHRNNKDLKKYIRDTYHARYSK